MLAPSSFGIGSYRNRSLADDGVPLHTQVSHDPRYDQDMKGPPNLLEVPYVLNKKCSKPKPFHGSLQSFLSVRAMNNFHDDKLDSPYCVS